MSILNNNHSLMTVKYHGKDIVIAPSDKVFRDSADSLVCCTSTIKKVAGNDPAWKDLAHEVECLTKFVLDPNTTLKRYQVEVINQGLLPYLVKMNQRLHFDQRRFRQISAIISAVTISSEGVHPSMMLLSLDEVVDDLRVSNRVNLFRSELLTNMEAAVDRQWQPIIRDTRGLLLNIAGKFLAVGFIGIIGWPIAFVYPLYRVALNMAAIASEYQSQHRITATTAIEVAKTLVVVFACAQLLSILSMYASVGYFCMACGVGALFLASNKATVKMVVPVLAPHVVQVDAVVRALDTLDLTVLIDATKKHAQHLATTAATHPSRVPLSHSSQHSQQHQSSAHSHSSNSSASPVFRTSSQVEELPPINANTNSIPPPSPNRTSAPNSNRSDRSANSNNSIGSWWRGSNSDRSDRSNSGAAYFKGVSAVKKDDILTVGDDEDGGWVSSNCGGQQQYQQQQSPSRTGETKFHFDSDAATDNSIPGVRKRKTN